MNSFFWLAFNRLIKNGYTVIRADVAPDFVSYCNVFGRFVSGGAMIDRNGVIYQYIYL